MARSGRAGTGRRRPVVTAPATDRGTVTRTGRATAGIGRPAVLIGMITGLATVVGFGRQLVFAHTVGATPLGTAYATANQVPNIIYAIVLGGALTGLVVPVLAGSARTGAKDETRRTASALLTWTLLLLVPVSVAVALAARPIVSLLLGSGHGNLRAGMLEVGSRMLVVFAPQIVLYGLAVVGFGILQAHRRFTFPALAPVLSSIVVAAAYFAFVPLADGHGVADLPLPAELMLSVGTTAGVVALAVTALAPVRRLRLRLRPALHFPPGIAAQVRTLAVAGIAAVVAQNLSTGVVIVLANAHGGSGALVLYNYGWQVFFVPYAVLAVPIATSAFPVLSASAQDEGQRAGAGAAAASASPEGVGFPPGVGSPQGIGSPAGVESPGGVTAHAGGTPDFDAAAASSTRAAVLVSWLGAGLLAGACVPVARVFVTHDPAGARELAWALAAFAVGLAGFGLAANLSRVLFACRRARIAAIAVTGGWLLVIAADLVIVPLVRANWVVPALGLGNTIGLTVAGIALVAAVRRARGAVALHGVTRAGLAGLAGALASAAAGLGVCAALPASGFFPNIAVVLLACVSATLAFGLVAFALDGGELRALAARARAKLAR
jgi:putative peptidoglycan lipid II flippase